MSEAFRIEHDLIGAREIPSSAMHGVHTARAIEHFPLSGRPVHPALVSAFGQVKLACALTNRGLGIWADDAPKADAIERACREMAEGLLTAHVVVDQLQGGAGTSTNMNVNEVLANRALQLLGEPEGRYARVSPLDDLNCHQSTNDTYPTALRLAAIVLLHRLEAKLVALQESFQVAEKRFAHVVKVGRTQLQDAVAFNRDRWRIYKCEERLRVINLGGTAIGTGLTAPRQYIFRAADALREITGIGFARAENLVEATQNADVFVEVSGMLKACAVSMLKVSTDLRILSSGPQAGLGEIRLPPMQAGSSIMPGKVNPVIPEAVSQAAMLAMGHDVAIGMACAAGNLELNPFLPLVAACLLESIDVLTSSADILRRFCVDGIEANEERCRGHLHEATSVLTALVSVIGYERATAVAEQAHQQGRAIRAVVLDLGLLSAEQFDQLTSPESVCRLGMPSTVTRGDQPPTYPT